MFEMSLLGVKYEVVRTSELDDTLVLRRKND